MLHFFKIDSHLLGVCPMAGNGFVCLHKNENSFAHAHFTFSPQFLFSRNFVIESVSKSGNGIRPIQ